MGEIICKDWEEALEVCLKCESGVPVKEQMRVFCKECGCGFGSRPYCVINKWKIVANND